MRSADIWSKEREQAEILENGLKVLLDQNQNSSQFYLIVWKPKAVNPYMNYVFHTEAKRDSYLEQAINNYDRWIAEKKRRKLDRLGSDADLAKVKVGDIFNHSWGYEQTNQDFYQVIEKKSRTLTLRKIGSEVVGSTGNSMAARVKAVKDSFLKDEKPFKKRIQFSGGEPYITIKSYGWCSLWNGQPVYESWYA